MNKAFTEQASLRKLIDAFHEQGTDESIMAIEDELLWMLQSGGRFIVPVSANSETGKRGIDGIVDEDGDQFLPVYTSGFELEASTADSSEYIPFERLMIKVLESGHLKGMVVDPFGDSLELAREVLWDLYYLMPADAHDREFRNALMTKALRFAADMHEGQLRKGTEEPYITHPVEVMSILNSMNKAVSDPELMIAGILHDTVEDTEATADMIAYYFGPDVSKLVLSHTYEDDGADWQEHRERRIASMEKLGAREKILAFADLLANERSMVRDFRACGEALWERFSASKDQIRWYHGGMIEALAELEEMPEAKRAYGELKDTFAELFVEG